MDDEEILKQAEALDKANPVDPQAPSTGNADDDSIVQAAINADKNPNLLSAPTTSSTTLVGMASKYFSESADYVGAKYQMGREQVASNILWHKALTGKIPDSEALADTSEARLAKFKAEKIDPMEVIPWGADLPTGFRVAQRMLGETAGLLPNTLETIGGGVRTAAMTAGAGAVASLALPITAPAAATAGWGFGFAGGSFASGANLMAADMYGTLIKAKVPRAQAQGASIAYGIFGGAIEAMQLRGLSKLGTKAMQEFLASAAGKKLVENSIVGFSKEMGKQVLEEEAQEIGAIITEFAHGAIDFSDPKVFDKMKKRLADTFTATLLGSPGLGAASSAAGRGLGMAINAVAPPKANASMPETVRAVMEAISTPSVEEQSKEPHLKVTKNVEAKVATSKEAETKRAAAQTELEALKLEKATAEKAALPTEELTAKVKEAEQKVREAAQEKKKLQTSELITTLEEQLTKTTDPQKTEELTRHIDSVRQAFKQTVTEIASENATRKIADLDEKIGQNGVKIHEKTVGRQAEIKNEIAALEEELTQAKTDLETRKAKLEEATQKFEDKRATAADPIALADSLGGKIGRTERTETKIAKIAADIEELHSESNALAAFTKARKDGTLTPDNIRGIVGDKHPLVNLMKRHWKLDQDKQGLELMQELIAEDLLTPEEIDKLGVKIPHAQARKLAARTAQIALNKAKVNRVTLQRIIDKSGLPSKDKAKFNALLNKVLDGDMETLRDVWDEVQERLDRYQTELDIKIARERLESLAERVTDSIESSGTVKPKSAYDFDTQQALSLYASLIEDARSANSQNKAVEIVKAAAIKQAEEAKAQDASGVDNGTPAALPAPSADSRIAGDVVLLQEAEYARKEKEAEYDALYQQKKALRAAKSPVPTALNDDLARARAAIVKAKKIETEVMANIADTMETLIAGGKVKRLEIEFERAKKLNETKQTVKAEANGTKPLYTIVTDPITGTQTKIKNKFNKVLRYIRRAGETGGSWNILLGNMFQDSLTRESESLLDVHDEVQTELHNIEEQKKIASEMLTDENKDLRKGMIKIVREGHKPVNWGQFVNQDGVYETLEVSLDVAMEMYAFIKSDIRQEGIKSGNKFTFNDNTKNARQIEAGEISTESLLESIMDQNPAAKAIVENGIKYYNTYSYDRLNPHHIDEFGYVMPKLENYSGHATRQGGANGGSHMDMFNSFSDRRSLRPTSFLNVEESKKAYVFNGFLSSMDKYIRTTERWIAWREKDKILRSVFSDPQIKEIIEGKLSADTVQIMNHTYQSLVGTRGVQHVQQSKLADFFRNQAASALTAGRPFTSLNQFSGVINGLMSVGYVDFAKGAADFMLHPIRSAKIMNATKFMKNRSGNMVTEWTETAQAQNVLGVDRNLNTLKAFAWFISAYDKTAIYAGFWPTYKATFDKARAAGLSEEEAHAKAVAKFERQANQLSGSATPDQMTHFERGGSINKTLSLFGKPEIQAFQAMLVALRRAISNPNKESLFIAARVFLAAHVAQGVFQLITSVPALLSGDDDEIDKSLARIFRAFLKGPSIPLAGDFLDACLIPFTNELFEVKEKAQDPRFIISSALVNAQKFNGILLKLAEEGDLSQEDAFKFVETYSKSYALVVPFWWLGGGGVPLAAVTNEAKKYAPVAESLAPPEPPPGLTDDTEEPTSDSNNDDQ